MTPFDRSSFLFCSTLEKWVSFFFFFWPYRAAYGIFVPHPGIEPVPSALQHKVLTTGPPRKCPQKRFLMLCAEDRDGSVQHVQTGLFSSGTNMALSAPRKLNLLNSMSLVYFLVKCKWTKSKWTNCCCSFAKSYPTLCDPMDCSTQGFPVHHQPPELAQTHVHQVGNAIQPSHPQLSPSPPAFNLSQHQGLFQWVSSSHQVAKVLEL